MATGDFLDELQRRLVRRMLQASIMKTFEEAYCERHGCSPAAFRRRVFWQALHRHVIPFAPILVIAGYFAPERELISGCGRARSMQVVLEELESYLRHPANARWLRRRWGFRLSTRRFRRFAKEYLPGARLLPPIAVSPKRPALL